MDELVNKVAVVTGAASGIGRALAEQCAAEKMKIVLADVELAMLEEVEDQLRSQGAEILAVPTDVAKAESLEQLAKQTVDHFGGVHLLFNNAGVAVSGPIWQATIADWEWVLGVNLWGVVHGIRSFVPQMLAQNEPAHIVNTASIAGMVSTPGLGVYNVTKHGVVTLSETLYQELQAAQSQIGVSVLCPGWVKTRIGESERNRPGESARNRPGESARNRPDAQEQNESPQLGGAGMAQAIANGLPPAEVASQVFAAIREQRFYILTHPEMTPLVQARHEEIRTGCNPSTVGLAESDHDR